MTRMFVVITVIPVVNKICTRTLSGIKLKLHYWDTVNTNKLGAVLDENVCYLHNCDSVTKNKNWELGDHNNSKNSYYSKKTEYFFFLACSTVYF